MPNLQHYNIFSSDEPAKPKAPVVKPTPPASPQLRRVEEPTGAVAMFQDQSQQLLNAVETMKVVCKQLLDGIDEVRQLNDRIELRKQILQVQDTFTPPPPSPRRLAVPGSPLPEYTFSQ